MKASEPFISLSPHKWPVTERVSSWLLLYELKTPLDPQKVPFSMTQFYIYDKVQNILNPDRAYSPVSNAIAGALAGGFAAFITTPLDNIKTCLNTQESLLTTLGPNCEACPVKDGGDLKFISLLNRDFRLQILSWTTCWRCASSYSNHYCLEPNGKSRVTK